MQNSNNKKKKRYALFLFSSERADEARLKRIENCMQQALKTYTVIRFEDPDEALKSLIVKQIDLVFIDSSLFEDDIISVEYALECKKRRLCPILFVAQNPVILVENYKKYLYTYEEFDEYFSEPLDFIDIEKKLARIESSQGRMAKRFIVNTPVRLFRLNTNTSYPVMITDISLVGFGIAWPYPEELFSKGEQVQIKLPLTGFDLFHQHYGEFLPLSGKTQRISIDGKTVGFSIEFLTPQQTEVLLQIVQKAAYKNRTMELAEGQLPAALPTPAR